MSLLQKLELNKALGKKSLAVLIDPDKIGEVAELIQLLNLCSECKVDYLFVGGSLITNDSFSRTISVIKENSNIPVLIFPGNSMQIDANADALLFLSLISGRNPDFLIGQHVLAAPKIKKAGIETISMGYMLINSGEVTSVSYMSNTIPIPSEKAEIAVCTAMAGEMLGLKSIYLEAGSGAKQPVPAKVIRSVKKSVDLPIVVGGGLNTTEKVESALDAGADIIVIGNAIEKNQDFLMSVAEKIYSINLS